MSAGASLHTSLLVCAMQGEHPARQTLARQLMARAMTEGWMICYSALGDFLTLVLREQRMPAAQARKAIDLWTATQRPVAPDAMAWQRALDLARATGVPLPECLIVATCAAHGVQTLYTDRTQDRPRHLLGVELVNPFSALSAPDTH